MSAFDAFLAEQLREIEQRHLRRKLRRVTSAQGATISVDGRELLNFSSNDYLGLANDPRLIAAGKEALERFGAGSGASRLISGSLQPHHALEDRIAEFKAVEAALSFASGYAAALGTIPALVGKSDFIVIDKLVHASIVDAARLAGATMRIFAHNDVEDLEKILKWCAAKRTTGTKVLIVTETVFSMDGDLAPLREIVALKEQYDTWLMVDEAHATGIFGQNRRGLVEEVGLAGRVEVQMGTLGKAVGASGGFICGSRRLIEFLVNKARSFIFSTAPPPAASASAMAGLEIIASEEGETLRSRLWANFKAFEGAVSPIVPVIIGGEEEAMERAKSLMEQGFFVPAVRYPTVPRNRARLRISLSAFHTEPMVARLRGALTGLAHTHR